MNTFEILCATMNQKDFSKLNQMNVRCNIIYANQADKTAYDELVFEGGTAKMITTATRGVGINRNLALMYASSDICLFADDDMVYKDDVENIVLSEFSRLKKADAIIFNVISENHGRKQKINKKTKKMTGLSLNPYGAVRLAVRLNSIKHNNIWFSPMFGGGAPYPSGEDSLFIRDMQKSKMKIYISDKLIGTVKQEASTWFFGTNEQYFIGKGTFNEAARKGIIKYAYVVYYALRTNKTSNVSFLRKIKAMLKGMKEYRTFCK